MEFSGNFRQEDVHHIKNPAYVVRGDSQCVVEWNEEFRILTNFTPSDIDNNQCYKLICGIWEPDWELEKKSKNLEEICKVDCPVRAKEHPSVLRNIWINSKDQCEDNIKKKVDIYIFPFQVKQVRYALHVLFDQNHSHSFMYFWERFWDKVPSGLNVFQEEFPLSYTLLNSHLKDREIPEDFKSNILKEIKQNLKGESPDLRMANINNAYKVSSCQKKIPDREK